MGRRASSKLKIAGGPAGKKRKANESDDSDFGGVVAKPKKSTAPKQSKPVGGMLSYLNPEPSVAPKTKKASPKAKAPSVMAKALLESLAPPLKKEKSNDIWMDQASGSDAPKAAKSKAPAPMKKAAPTKRKADFEEEDEEDEEDIRPTASRKPRAAAIKPVKYDDFDSESDGDDMLFDVGKMVKGIDTASMSATDSRPLFSASMSRPGSSAGLPKKSVASKVTEIIDDDETNYSMLVPPTKGKGPAPTAKKNILSDDASDSGVESSEEVAPVTKASKPKPAPKASTAKPAAKPKAQAKAPAASKPGKASSQPAESKKILLSPAAKAYAAKKAKQEKLALEAVEDSEDELEKVANEILDEDDEDEEELATRRPARRAAAVTQKKWVISDDEDRDEGTTAGFEDEDSDD